jgi:bifunctional UDP-N-acetylglucosamine pyrophosphorylase/glucosamine-1-phosphate N-acetyltransferase
MSNTPLDIIILAAGKGTRMRSRLPKVLQTLAGRPILAHVLATVQALEPRNIVVIVGHEAELVQKTFPDKQYRFAMQAKQLGTGHAVQQALPHLPADGCSLILYADVPLITLNTLEKLITTTPANAIGILTATMENPFGLGRIVRNQQNEFSEIIEEADATAPQKLINEINAGIYVFPNAVLHKYLSQLDNNNAQKEYYLPPIIKLARATQTPIVTCTTTNAEEVFGINDRKQLMQAERILQRRCAKELMESGVTIIDAERLDIRGFVAAEQDVTLDINVICAGEVTIGEGSYIGPNTLLKDVRIGKNVTIKSHCILEGVTVADNCTIGPFANLRPGTVLDSGVKIGNFVELKKSHIGTDSKINHLSYIGDALVGKDVNIGAGTITCNYNGVDKHLTKIGDEAFIGSNTALVAPVTIGEHAVIGAGSVITKDAPAGELTLTRSEQKNLGRWKKPTKKETT